MNKRVLLFAGLLFAIAGPAIAVDQAATTTTTTQPQTQPATPAAEQPAATEQAVAVQKPLSDTELFQKECGACHFAFPARFLPARSWQKIMTGLGDHFGEDASLDDATVQRLTDYLSNNAGRYRGRDTPIRITELRWFVHEHNEEVSAWSRKKAGHMSNCMACHRTGRMEDDD